MRDDSPTPAQSALMAAAEAAGRAIPPLWPLASSVAVNPYLGQTGERLATAGARLARVAGAPVTMPRDWYAARIRDGRITDADLAGALAAAPIERRPADLAALERAAARPSHTPGALPSVADLAADASRQDWPGLVADRIGAWAAAYFDAGQALWAAPARRGAWAEWRAVATHDLTPEIQGLRGFAAHVHEAPETADGAIARAAQRLGLGPQMLETYFHRLLMDMGGWAQYARYCLWQAERAGGTDPIMTEMLAIRLTWEEALYLHYADAVADTWQRARAAHALPVAASSAQVVDEILQEAAERAGQRALAATLAAAVPTAPVSAGSTRAEDRPALQAAFCIDVRSEVFRRALEAADPEIETLGFAGFFGLGAQHRGFASDVDELRLPVLLPPAITTARAAPGRRRPTARPASPPAPGAPGAGSGRRPFPPSPSWRRWARSMSASWCATRWGWPRWPGPTTRRRGPTRPSTPPPAWTPPKRCCGRCR